PWGAGGRSSPRRSSWSCTAPSTCGTASSCLPTARLVSLDLLMLTALTSLKSRWRSGTTTTNAWLAIPDALPAEIAARSGFDSLCIDMQHGLVDQAAAVRILQAASGTGVPVLVRAAWNEPATLMRALDAGAAGVIVPM